MLTGANSIGNIGKPMIYEWFYLNKDVYNSINLIIFNTNITININEFDVILKVTN